ncbi:HepT-like ribonuclease domain-containing protein [Fibrella arboris]|uniref:HepT-like ribonuclease domain-containing protein n=1 Tax=Fibrella arboris TaxID=3242486 RepID=UPI0035209327
MPSTPKTDLVYFLRILEAIGKINTYTSGYEDPYVFFEANDQKDFNASLLLLMHIGEQVSRISEPLRNAYTQIPWTAIKGFRNIIAHDYVNVDRFIVFDTIRQQLPDLQLLIEHIIRTEMAHGTFDKTDYDLSKESTYYRHIDFEKIA